MLLIASISVRVLCRGTSTWLSRSRQCGSFYSIKPLCIHKNFILCLWASTACVYWLHCTSFSSDQISAFAPEQPLEVFMKNFDYFFALCAHINSVPFHGLLCLLLLLCPRGVQVSPSHTFEFATKPSLSCLLVSVDGCIDIWEWYRVIHGLTHSFVWFITKVRKRRKGTEEWGWCLIHCLPAPFCFTGQILPS